MLALSFLEIISIITAFQLLMLGVVLLTKRNRISNLVLSFFMFANALLLIWFIIRLLDLAVLPSFSLFYYLLGPLILLYVKSLTERDFRVSGKLLIHGSVFLGIGLYWLARKIIFFQSVTSAWTHWEFIITQIVLHVQIAAYIVASLIRIKNYRQAIKQHFSSVAKINLTWLLLIIMAFALMWLTDFYAFILSVTGQKTPVIINRLLLLSILINFVFASALVYKGLHHAGALTGLIDPQKYYGSQMRDDEMENIREKLIDMMEHSKPYLNPNLTIKELSEQLNIHQKYLSQVINAQFGQNFYDFVNQYRVQEAKEIMSRNPGGKKTILEVLYEVGFNSKSAFNNAFKKNTGKTPSEFRRLVT